MRITLADTKNAVLPIKNFYKLKLYGVTRK